MLDILREQKCELLDCPKAYYWDVEYKDLFDQIGVKAVQRNSMYTTVHDSALRHNGKPKK